MDELKPQPETRHEQALAQFRRDAIDEKDVRDEALRDMEFRAGDQWDPEIKRRRNEEGRPALTFDKTHVYIQSVANEARQNKPQPKVNALGGGATTDVANVINGILRHVQHRSHADVAVDTALDYSAGSSFGYIRAITEYADPKSFDQELRILAVRDPLSIYGILMPTCRGEKPDHAFVIATLKRDEYKRLYGDAEQPTDFESAEWRAAGDWVAGDDVRIAEYWYCEDEKKTLRHVAAPDGSTAPIYTDDPSYREDMPFVSGEDGAPKEREVTTTVVKFCKIDGLRIIPKTETEWTGDSIPIEAVLGQQLIVGGEVKLFSLIRFIRDTQQLINIYESAIAEKIALGNRVPYLGYKGVFADGKWKTANVKNYPYLEVEPVVLPDGSMAPLPQRQQMEEQITALSNALRQEIDNLKSGMGIYDASLGNKSNETSGVGIKSRQQQSNVTNFHFSDNLNRAEWELYVKLLKVIPKIYDRPGRQVRIVGEDQQHSVIVINQQYLDPETQKPKHYPLDVGEYDVVVTTGPSYSTARLEGADTLQQFFQVAPQAVPLLGDLWVGSLDYPWSREGARRLKAAAPQNIVNEDQGGDQKIPPAVAQQMQQMQEELKHTQAFAQSLHEQLAAKQPEIDAKLQVAAMQEETKRTLGLAALNSKEGISLLEQEIASLQSKYDQIHQANMTAAGHEHDAQQQSAGHAHEAGQAAQAQQAAADQAQQARDAAPETDQQ